MIKQKSPVLILWAALFFCVPFFCFSQEIKTGAEVLNYTIPVLKRAKNNPIQRIRIYVPDKATSTRQLVITTDPASAAAIGKIEIFTTGSEPKFSDEMPVTAITTIKVKNTIPVHISLKPGINYLWVSVLLNDNTLPDKKIDLQTDALSLSNGNTLALQPINRSQRGWYTGIALRQPGDDSVHTYRIPGITQTATNTLIAVYDIRYKHSGDLPADIDVGMSRSTDNGKTWEPMKVIMKMGGPGDNSGIGDPSILFDPVTKKIWVAALWSKGNHSIAGSGPGLSPDVSGQFILASSADDGKTWSAPINITAQVKNPIWHLYFQGPGNGIAMQNGTLVFPSQYWDESKNPGMPHASIIYSNDHGKTWKSGIGAKSNTTEAQVVETKPGTLMLNMRDNRGGFRSIATTRDLGSSWLEHPTSFKALQDPVCMASLIKARVKVNGALKEVLFFSNMNSSGVRDHLTIKASLDLGETWLPAHQLLLDERRSFGYSSLVKVDEHTIGILYESTGGLNFVTVPVKDIIRQ
ncbi:sialidase family protein [Niabella beijingensis]|uniref:sialidase family protein n=1 Tax=Niabella beijingensis TaxID=2872700 RepID=UPI001CC18CC2|nr:sialidase family protein [Niabella beijingensis]MBZ4191379.1 exo-alpha-sialidase [Niabella beijingensis]